MNEPLRVGDLSITAINDGYRYADARGLFDRTEEDWRPHRNYVDDALQLRLEYGGFLVRTPHSLVLVDPGCSPSTAIDSGHFFESLRATGVDPTEVTHVVFTHLHLDHVGSAVAAEQAAFTTARYFCHLEEWSFFAAGPPTGLDRDIHRRNEVTALLEPLHDRLELWSGSSNGVTDGVTVEHTPGHTPGSAVVVVAAGAERAMLLGDVVHCPVELTDPEWGLIQDVDPDLAGRTRRSLTARIEDGSVAVTAGHFPGLAFGRVLPGRSRRWTYV